jgi:hypothetical protein
MMKLKRTAICQECSLLALSALILCACTHMYMCMCACLLLIMYDVLAV